MNSLSFKLSLLSFRSLDNAKKYICKVYKNSHCRLWSYAQIIFPFDLAGLGVLSKDPTVWLDGASPPPKVLVNNFQIENDFFQ